MLDIKEIDAEIEKLENCNLTYNVCQKLANMYIIKDHWEKKNNMKVENNSISPLNNDSIVDLKEKTL